MPCGRPRVSPESPGSRFGSRSGTHAVISFIDNGPGVDDPSKLFRAFQEGSNGSGLGLYIARTMIRSFDGDLIYVPQTAGCRFDVVLPLADAEVLDAERKDA
jgi:signal transduction histidine kinase